jgi:predicted alpha-1,6-mannanase (GH76 family)
VNAVYDGLTDRGVIIGGGGGDGGLFNAILARYLAFVVVNLTWESNEDIRAKEIAAQIVLASAEAAWKNRLEVEGLPLFGHDWTRDATLPRLSGELATFEGGTVRSSSVPERDLSVQVGGWMLMEAAYVVSAAGYPRARQ